MSFRELCPALHTKTYFNYGGQGPLPIPSLSAITESWHRIQDLGPFTTDVWPFIAMETKSTRQVLANMCGVPPNRLALTENVTTGCVLPLWGISFRIGDELLISDCEHPGVFSNCVELARRKKLNIKVLAVKQLRGDNNDTQTNVIKAIEKSLTPRTRLVVLSHLLWNTGQIMPIEIISEQLQQHPNKPFLMVDAAQSFGQIPIHEAASKADIFGFTGHKWACGPEGLGGVSLSDRVIAEVNPTVIGWRSIRDESKLNLNNSDPFYHDSRRFEIATSCIPLMAGLRKSLELINAEGTSQERLQRILNLSNILWQKLKNIEGIVPLLKSPPSSGLVSFQLSKDLKNLDLVKKLGKKKIWIRDLADPVCIRACTHISSTSEEIQILCEAIEA